jgi:transformation/transcription domain-associated protein
MTWRQHVFHLINNAFKPLAEVSLLFSCSLDSFYHMENFVLINNYTNLLQVNPSLAYIGHHETAWTINKFSHVARKHQLVEVCLNSLSKISFLLFIIYYLFFIF